MSNNPPLAAEGQARALLETRAEFRPYRSSRRQNVRDAGGSKSSYTSWPRTNPLLDALHNRAGSYRNDCSNEDDSGCPRTERLADQRRNTPREQEHQAEHMKNLGFGHG
jgi:hypothetical protein